MIRLTVSGLVLAALLMTGCASPVKESEQMIRQGQVNEGLAKLEEAIRNDPDNLSYRAALYRDREAVINEKLVRADSLLAKHKFDEAELIYQDVLTMQADNPRAVSGLSAIASGRRQDNQAVEAQRLMKEGRPEEAKALLKAVLTEDPGHAKARELMKSLDRDSQQPGFVPPSLAAAYKRPVSLEFRNAPLPQVFNALSMQTQLNFIFDKDVRPDLKTTIFVRNVPLEEAINLILVTNQLDKKVLNESSMLIYPNQPAKQKDYQELEIKSFYLTNADAKSALTMLKTLLKTRDIFVDEKLNLLIMRDTPEVVAMAEKLIEAQDKPEPEVMLDVEVLEVSRDRLTNLGILYPPSVTASVSSRTTNSAVAAGSAVVQTTQTNLLTLQSLKNLNAGDIGISDLSLTANLLKTDTDTDILANPRIRVKNHDKAKIHVGDRVPVITSTSSPTTGVSESVTYLDVGLKLEVEPTVYLDDDVGIKVNLEVSNIINTITSATTGTTTYQLGTREATTNLRLKDGETQILAGLIDDQDSKTANKIPGLGDLPILGHLFSNHHNDKSKSEIVLLITPHIVRNLERPGANITQFRSGTEANLGAEPLQVRSLPAPVGIGHIQKQPVPAQPENGPQPSPLHGMTEEPVLPASRDLSGDVPNRPRLAPQTPEPVPETQQ
ncbi:MAG: secretin N-terminal domain-containing protein [Thiobacillaceae bacterium]